jgi:hypothetical protein
MHQDLTRARQFLVLEPTIPKSIPSWRVHSVLSQALEGRLASSHRCQTPMEYIVRIRSEALAKEYRGTTININRRDYRYEYTNCHSSNFICKNVQGILVEDILQSINQFCTVETEAINFVLQSRNRPLLALHFCEPQQHVFSFDIRAQGWPLSFKRENSICTICQDLHVVTKCKEIVKE